MTYDFNDAIQDFQGLLSFNWLQLETVKQELCYDNASLTMAEVLRVDQTSTIHQRLKSYLAMTFR